MSSLSGRVQSDRRDYFLWWWVDFRIDRKMNDVAAEES